MIDLATRVRLRVPRGRHGRKIIAYRQGKIIDAKLPSVGAWLIGPDCDPDDESPFHLGMYFTGGAIRSFRLFTSESGIGVPYTHTLFPDGSLQWVSSFKLISWFDEQKLLDSFGPTYFYHTDLHHPSPRSGGCGGYTMSQPLVVVPTPHLCSVVVPDQSRSGLTMTIKTRHKPP